MTNAHASAVYDAYLDPDGDGFITESGTPFTNGTTEAGSFELIDASVSGWVKLIDISEVSGDVTPVCGNADLITDDDGSDFAYYNIIDPTPGTPSSGDEFMLFRFRLSKAPNGSFGYNFLIDSDMTYGPGIDANSTCGNQGFEREVQFANAGGKKGVSVYDVDGSTTFTSTLCGQCVSNLDAQVACAASSGGCNTPTPSFITFPVSLVHLGIPSNTNTNTLYIASGTANSGNATSVLGGKNASDIGALDANSTGCTSCSSLSGCELFDCRTDCINAALLSTLPVTFAGFSVVATAGGHRLQWTTQRETDNAYFSVEQSTDGRQWHSVTRLPGAGTSTEPITYTYVHAGSAGKGSYYRIRQVDYDGTFSFSPVQYLSNGRTSAANRQLIVYPTLVQDGQLYLNLAQLKPVQPPTFIITDTNGKTQSHHQGGGSGILTMDVSGLPAGTYFIRPVKSAVVSAGRFIKQ